MYVNVLICNERDAHVSVQMEAWYNWVFCVVELHKAEKDATVWLGRQEQDMGNKMNSLQSKQRRSHLSHDETL